MAKWMILIKKCRKIAIYSVPVLIAARDSSWVPSITSADVEHNPSAIGSVPKVSGGLLSMFLPMQWEPQKCMLRSASLRNI